MYPPLADSHFAKYFIANRPSSEPNSSTQSTITALNLRPHPEGGYYAETDRDSLLIPNPFNTPGSAAAHDLTRNASTTIFYLLTPKSPAGHFHRNKARTVHTLHQGRGRYVTIHENGKLESFVVGHDVDKGEKLQWIVDGGKYKASYLLPDLEGGNNSQGGLLISETVVPGFEFRDHDFLTAEGLKGLVSEEEVKELGWLMNEGEREKLSQG